MPTFNEQLELEKEMLQSGVDRYHHNTNKLLGKGIESSTKHGRAAIAAVVNAVADGVTEIVTDETSNRDIARKKLRGMNAHQVAYLSLITIVDEVSKRFTLMTVARHVGMNVEFQQRLSEWVDSEAQSALRVIKKANEKTSKQPKRAGLAFKMKKDG